MNRIVKKKLITSIFILGFITLGIFSYNNYNKRDESSRTLNKEKIEYNVESDNYKYIDIGLTIDNYNKDRKYKYNIINPNGEVIESNNIYDKGILYKIEDVERGVYKITVESDKDEIIEASINVIRKNKKK